MIIAADTRNADYMIHQLNDEWKKWGLAISFQKSKYLVIGGETEILNIEVKAIKNCEEFKYLGSVFSRQPNCKKDIDERTQKKKQMVFGGVKGRNKKRIYRS